MHEAYPIISANRRGLVATESTRDDLFRVDECGVREILVTGDRKVEFILYEDKVLAHVPSSFGTPAYYPLQPVKIKPPVKAVLMDLDGTSVQSEPFWIWIIQQCVCSLLGNSGFELEESDLPHVSGHSVSEHLQYCINKYCPGESIGRARQFYFEHTRREMSEILEGRGRVDAFKPRPGLKEFLMELKSRNILIALVTSGLYEKAYPEILAAFRALDMGDPVDFYDAIITAGFPMRKGESVGTLGELAPKPHPWLYAEACHIGLQVPHDKRNHVIGIEDSGAGVCSVRLAGFPVVGMADGNIEASGCQDLCQTIVPGLENILPLLDS